MKYEFLNIFLDPKELMNQTKKKINPFLLENNSSQIEQIYNFYKSNENLLYVNGFIGTGKAEIVNYSTSFLSSETIVLKYNCFNATVLDDILLSFFLEFKKLSSQNIVSEPKIKSENFTQKINSYFSQIEKSFVIILDSFEAILDENRHEIVDFIFHLISMQKVKVIIIGRTFESKYFANVSVVRVITQALEKPIFDKFMKFEKVKAPNVIIEEFYKHTRGYYFFTALSLIIMKNQNISLVDFLTNLKNSYLPFNKFLEKQAMTLVPPNERNLFLFLCLIRHPVSMNLLKMLKFCDEESVKPLIENMIVLQNGEEIYVQDYLKDEADESTSPHILNKIRQYIIDLYSTQLPLKPTERNICISRQTMRKEIEYHNFFLPKKPKNVASVDINYLSYSQVFGLGDKSKTETKGTFIEESKTNQGQQIDLTQRKNIQINLDNLPFQSKNTVQNKSIVNGNLSKEEKEGEILSFKDIIILIKQSEKQYQYSRVIDLCKKALLMDQEREYQTYLPLFYTKIASAYKKVADYEHSLEYYELALSFYQNIGNFGKVNRIKYSMANIFYETYSGEKAKELYLEIVKSTDSAAILVIKSYLKLANMEEDSSTMQNAYDYYRLALERAEEIDSVETLSELYFKYALILDDKNDVKSAIEFYNKCINLSDDTSINKFLSPTYSNIATLYFEKHEIEDAIANYTKAYEIDEKSNNLEGIYYSASKLASILHRRNSEKALEYYKRALECAKDINDVFYIISATLELGDYHYDMKQDEIALKYYFNAMERAKNNLSQDNISKINTRINDLKFRLGVEKFDRLINLIRESENEDK